MCIDTVSLPNVSRYDDISIYCCISTCHTELNQPKGATQMPIQALCAKCQCLHKQLYGFNENCCKTFNDVPLIKADIKKIHTLLKW